MKRTITALYQSRAEAQAAAAALKNANLGADVEIVDQTAADAHPEHKDFIEWLGGFFDGHEDKHAYEEGLRRGHFLLTAKVDDLKETHAAEILDAANPLDLDAAQRSWRTEGWKGPESTADIQSPGLTPAPSFRIVGVSIRSYGIPAAP